MSSAAPFRWTDIGLPTGQSQDLLATNVAGLVQNLEPSPLGGLRSLTGPTPIEPDRGAGYPSLGEAHGVFHTVFSGVYEMLLFRMGSVLYEHRGWTRTFTSLVTGLTDELRPGWPDQFVRVRDQIVWANGTDRARIILMTGQVLPLGFDRGPTAPTVDGPDSPTEGEKTNFFDNSLGLSWPGHIGTPGEVLDDSNGKMLASTHSYRWQMQDSLGNRSPWSAESQVMRLDELVVRPPRFAYIGGYTTDLIAEGMSIEDAMKRFVVTLSASDVAHHTVTNLARSQNMRYDGNKHYTRSTWTSAATTIFSDGASDGSLGPRIQEVYPVPLFRVMGAHGGRLVVANTPTEPNVVYVSEMGFPGTFVEKYYVPESEVTCVYSHAGQVLLFTKTSMYAMTATGPTLVEAGVGCAGPKAVAALEDGSIVWLSATAVYRMGQGRPELISEPIRDFIDTGLNKSRLRMANAWRDPSTGTWHCAVTPAGQYRNMLVISWNPRDGWSRRDYDVIGLASVCVAETSKEHVFAASTVNGTGHALVLNRETYDFTIPPRSSIYRTRWLRVDELARFKFTLRDIHITFLETGKHTVTVKFYRDQCETAVFSQTMNLYDLPYDNTDNSPVSASDAVVGTAVIRNPRLATRYWSANGSILEGLVDVRTAMIEVTAVYPSKMHLLGISFSRPSSTAQGEPTGRIASFSATSLVAQ